MKIAPVSADLLIKLTLIAGAIGLGFYAVKKVSGAAGEAFTAFGDLGDNVGHWVGDKAAAADSAVANVIVGAGGVVGIPATDNDQCTLDIARGDTWAASFSCPAPRFFKEAILNPPKNVGVTGTW